MKQPSRARPTTKHVILFLAANPRDTGRLALDREAHSIHLELKRTGYRDRFDFVTRWAVEPLDLLRELRELKPTIVHFSGHGIPPAATTAPAQGRDVVAVAAPSGDEPGGVIFESAGGRGQVVTPDAFVQTLAAVGAQVRLVVLNACFTESMAATLVSHADCVVGVSGAIHDVAARSFAIGFYGGLGERASIAAAFAQGTAAINLEGLPDAERPQLKVRDGFDAAELILAAPSVLVKVPCPYPGMRPFAADDADRFHGRDAEITELISRLRAGEREIFVIGPSGSGKSSLVTAGVLPRLAQGVTGLGPFVVRELRPGEQPAARLGQALEVPAGELLVAPDRVAGLLAPCGRSTSLLLVVDQLEELFTLAIASERALFLDALRALRAERRCAVVFTLRADFFGALMESTLWAERRGQLSRIEVSPLRGEALREAIAAPARAVDVTVEPDLIERLVADAASEPGILPLLQETLVQLWDARADQTLMLVDYEALGDGERSGLAVALARRADTTLRGFNAVQTASARRILLRLISFGEGRSDTRRQQPLTQLRAAGEDAADFAFVLQTMVDDRLLTVDEDIAGEPRVDLAHEVIISAWPALADWIRNHRVDEQRRRRLAAAAAEHGRGARGLLDPIELADAAQRQQTESEVQLGQSAQVTALIAASRTAQTAQRRRRRLILSAVGLLGLVAVVVAAVAVTERGQTNEARRLENAAQKQRLRAEAGERKNQQLVAQSYAEAGRQLLVDHHFQEAVPYLLAARQSGQDGVPLRVLFREAKRHLPVIPALEHQGEVVSAAFSPDGTRVVTASSDNTARVWDAATGKPLTGALVHQGKVRSAAFSPDGTRVVTASDDSDDNTARVWDAATGKPLTGALEHQGPVWSAAFSSDGTRVITASEDKTARVWDAATGKPLFARLEHQGAVVSAAFSSDGTRVVTASEDKTARVWDAATGKPLTSALEHQGSVESAAFSPDGTRVVTVSEDNTARVWDAATGKPLTGALEHQGEVRSAAFSPDGTRVVTASDDNTARVWDATTGKPLIARLEHQDGVVSAAFNADGTRVVTASTDGTARTWDAVTGKPITSFIKDQRSWAAGLETIMSMEVQDRLMRAAFSPDGTRVVTASADGTARIWDAATGKPITSPLAHKTWVTSAAFSPDGARVVTASSDKTARVWDAATGMLLTGPLEHHDVVASVAFSPDGTRIVTASRDRTAQVWDAATGKPLTAPLKHQASVTSAAFSPDGARVVTASSDKTARVWDAATGKPVTGPLAHQDSVYSAAFSLDGARVVTASGDGTARVWDAATGKPLTSPLAHQDRVYCAAFSPDGTRVVTASKDKTARVWDAATGKPLTSPLAHQGRVYSAAFSPDGTRVVTASDDNTARVWDVSPDTETVDQWSAVAERSPFVLSEQGELVPRSPPHAQPPPHWTSP